MSLVDISFRVPGVALRNVDDTAFDNPSTVICAGKDWTACTVKTDHNMIRLITHMGSTQVHVFSDREV